MVVCMIFLEIGKVYEICCISIKIEIEKWSLVKNIFLNGEDSSVYDLPEML